MVTLQLHLYPFLGHPVDLLEAASFEIHRPSVELARMSASHIKIRESVSERERRGEHIQFSQRGLFARRGLFEERRCGSWGREGLMSLVYLRLARGAMERRGWIDRVTVGKVIWCSTIGRRRRRRRR